MEKGIKITMPFRHLGSNNTEVQIESENIIYSEVCNGYGLQVNDETKRIKIETLCFEISKKVKELHQLTT